MERKKGDCAAIIPRSLAAEICSCCRSDSHGRVFIALRTGMCRVGPHLVIFNSILRYNRSDSCNVRVRPW